jgi:hypothetical protein
MSAILGNNNDPGSGSMGSPAPNVGHLYGNWLVAPRQMKVSSMTTLCKAQGLDTPQIDVRAYVLDEYNALVPNGVGAIAPAPTASYGWVTSSLTGTAILDFGKTFLVGVLCVRVSGTNTTLSHGFMSTTGYPLYGCAVTFASPEASCAPTDEYDSDVATDWWACYYTYDIMAVASVGGLGRSKQGKIAGLAIASVGKVAGLAYE